MATARASSSLTDATDAESRSGGARHALRGGRLTRRGRLFAAIIAILCLAPIVIAARLTPSAAGHGTHLQLGLPPCGWVAFFHHPCPTCGMTTSFSLAIRGELAAAARAQPMGLVLCIAAGVAFWVSLYACLTGAPAHRVLMPLFAARTLWALLALALAAWAYKWVTWSG